VISKQLSFQDNGMKCLFVFFNRIFHLLKQIIESNQSLEILSFGCWFESLFRIEELLNVLGKRQSHSIKQLHLASIKNNETHSITGTIFFFI
jgi:hypothetical protein